MRHVWQSFVQSDDEASGPRHDHHIVKWHGPFDLHVPDLLALFYETPADGMAATGVVQSSLLAPTSLTGTGSITPDTLSGGGGIIIGGGGSTTPTSGNDTLTGTSGNDTIDGLGGNDTISGQGGDDILAGNTGADKIDGGAGDDTIYSDAMGAMDHGTEVDTITGGDGSDTIYAGYGDNVDGSAGGDTLYISFYGAPSGITFDAHLTTQTIGGGTITGIEDYARIEGSNYDDYIDASGSSGYSNTQIYGMGGDDTIIAGYYTGLIDGGDGNDTLDGRNSQYLNEIDGGAGDDTIYAPTNENFTVANGGDGNDIIYSNYQAHGGNGNDTIYLSFGYYGLVATGDAGDDTIIGSDVSDAIQGNDGNDILHGNGGDDVIDGGAGADIITGGTGNDVLTGGADNDIFIFGQDDGKDTITDFAAGDVIQINGYNSAQSITQSGSDVIVTFSGTDQVTFQNTSVAVVQAGLQFMPATDETLTGTDGNDYLHGYGGNDTISGLGGSDTLIGGAGGDTIDGGAGDDTIYSDAASAMDRGTEVDTITGGDGSDAIYAGYGDNVDGGADGYYGDTLFISFQGATSGITFDAHLATQTIGGGTITGIENIGSVEGSNYSDYIDVGTTTNNGYSPFTTVYGMGGDDTIIAGYYTSLIDGGDGNDTLDGRNSQYLDTINGGAGDDIIYAPPGGAVANGGDGNDTIYGADEIHGGAGDDTIYVSNPYWGTSTVTGDDGNDDIHGSSVVDHIDGGAGNDTIDGGAGDDILRSGSGDNTLTGGAGNDYFIVGDGNNVITDFQAGDTIGIQASFAGNAIAQVGNNVVITFDNNNQLTFQNTDVATIKASLQSSVKVNDVAISPDGSVIYAAGDDGTLYKYDAATGALIHAWHVGTELGGMDISPDGSFAVVTELQPLASNYADPWWDNQFTVAVYKVDLATGQVTSYPLDVTGDNYSFYDVAILADGTIMASESILPGWSGGGRTLILDPTTGTYTQVGYDGQDTVLSVSEDGKVVLLAPENISDGPLVLYGSGQGILATHDVYQDGGFGFNRGIQAISDNGKLVAQSIYGEGLNIYDSQLKLIINLTSSHPEWTNGTVSGLAFDPSGKFLFVLDNTTDTIVVLSTKDWSTLGEVAVGTDISGWSGDFGDRLLISPDMSYFIVQTDTGFVKVAMPTTGTSGDDFLLGSSAADTMNGGGGNDTISGGTGNDTLTGGAGNDTFLYGVGDGSDTITDFTSGDVVKVSDYTSAQSITQVGNNVVVVFASGDQITFDNTTVSVVQAGLHFDVQPPMNLTGTAGNDTLTGGTGNDTLTGLGGNDILNGGPGADKMVGGTGNDTYYVDNAGDVVTELSGQGTDTVHSTISYTLPANVEIGILDGTSSINLTGNNLANTLTGNSGDNFLYGMAGADKLIGGAGNDVLDGGSGSDTLTGGAGADIFEFGTSPGNDKITDFVSGTDKLDFHLLSSVTAANVKTALSNGNTIVSVDVNHDGRADFTVTLVGVTHISASDYIFHT